MARVEGGAVIIETDWPGLKNQIDTRNLNFRYEENSTAYEIFAIDGQYFYKTTIYKSGQAPQDQASHDTWRAEFETSYKDLVTDFNNTQPFYLTNVDGYSVVLKDGAAPTVNDGYGIAIIGSDGSNYRLLKMDTSGRPILVGAGTAGSPVGGILTIQGDPSGEPIPVSGNITASNASVSDNDLTIPLFSNLIGGTDGTNLRPLRVFDVDTGGGQQWVLGVGLRKASGGGSVEAGTSSDPIRIDPTGTTTQPVSGTVTANQGGTWTVQPGNTANTTPWLTTISQGGNSVTVTGSNALKIDGSAVTQPVSGTITANAGTGNFTVVQATASNLRAQLASESATGAGIPSTAVMVGGSDGANLRSIFVDSSGRQFVVGAAANGAAVAGNPVLIAGSDGTDTRTIRTATDGTVRIDPTGTTTQPISVASLPLPAGAATEATLTGVLTTSGFEARINTLGQKTMANSTPITIASDQTVIPVSDNGGSITVDGTVTANQGTANTLANRWPIIVTDGTNTMPTGDIASRGIFHKVTDGTNTTAVKAASTAAVDTDPSLVIAFSPNSQLPTGSNTIGIINQGTSASLANAWSTKITDTTNGPVTVKNSGTAPISSDKALVVVLSPNQQAIPVSSAPALATPGLTTGRIVLGGSTANTLQSIRATVYNEQTSNGQRSVSSNSVNDTLLGTGARKVQIQYFTSTGSGPFTETVSLAGLVAVPTVATDICFIENIKVTEVGSGGANAGTITLYVNAAGGGGTIGTIGLGNLVAAVGDNTTLWAHHYVAFGKSASFATFIAAAYSGGSGTNATFYLKAKDPTSSDAAEIIVSDTLLITASFTRTLGIPLKINGFSRVVAYGIPGVNNATLAASFDFAEL